MKRIKINGYYILDESCDLNLKEYKPVKVKVLRKLRKGFYLVMPIEPVVYPIMDDGWAIKKIKIHKKHLSPTTVEERIVIRCPLNMPKINKNDELVLTKIYDALSNHGQISTSDILRLKAIIHKIRYVQSFNEVKI